MGKRDNKKKALRIVRNILIGIVAFCIIFYVGVRIHFRRPVGEYYKASVKGFKIPDLNGNFIPQGIAYDKRSGNFFLTGYTTDGTVSPVYLVSKETKKTIKKVYLCDKDGNDFVGHAGGLTVYGDYVYIAGGADNCLYVYSYDDVMKAESKGRVNCLGSFKTGDCGIAFTTVNDGILYVGEFYREQNYKTPESHKMTTTGGDYNQAIAIAYKLSSSDNSVFGIEKDPVAAYSLPDLAQGMAFNDGKIYISTSYGLVNSNIFCYDISKVGHGKKYTFNGYELPLYEFDSLSLCNTMVIAPFSEEIEFVDGLMYTMCEAASNKYIVGKFTSAWWCYATKEY